MNELIDKIGFLLLPKNFATILPYCFWYWILMTIILIWVLKKK